MERFKYKLTSPVLMWALIAIGGVILWQVVPKDWLFNSGIIGMVVLILGLINWFYITLAVLRVHRKAPASVNDINQLVDEGVYAVVRHPAYVADVILFWSIFVAFPLFKMLAVAVWATLVLLFWASLEERMLEEKFLEDYCEYKKRVPMFIPSFRRRGNNN